jgi:hypothetical protein
MSCASGSWPKASSFPLWAAADPITSVKRAGTAKNTRELPPLAPGQGWQSVQSLHELDDFRDLVSCVYRVVPGILRFLRIGYDAYQVTACWATVLARGAAHKMHQHPNNFLSGVYYVRTYPGADTVNFHDPRNQTGIIRPPAVELTAENTDQVVVRVKDARISGLPASPLNTSSSFAGDLRYMAIFFARAPDEMLVPNT